MAEEKLELFEKTDDGEIRKRQQVFARFFLDTPSIKKLAEARKLLESYSHLEPEKVTDHVVAIRDRAWDIDPYPCVGQFNFLDLSISRSPLYDEVLERVNHGQKLLDLGCCFGQDIRKLTADGAPSENLYGTDILQAFMNLGYDLFLDKSSLKATFIVADFLDPSSPLASLDNQIDIVHAAAVLHLFDRATQKKVVQRITRLLKPKAGSVCIGRQIGDTKPSEVAVGGGRILFRHNTDTFRELWDEVGKETDVKWSVQAKMDFDDPSFAIQSLQRSGDEAGWLVFSVRRIV